MNHVVRCVGDPDFGFPGDGGVEVGKGLAVGKGGDEHEAGTGGGEELAQFVFPLLIDGTVRGDGFDDNEPVSFDIMNKNVGGFAAGCEFDSEFCQREVVTENFLVGGVAEEKNAGPADEAWCEFFDDGADQCILATCGEFDSHAIRQMDDFTGKIAVTGFEVAGGGILQE